MYGDTIIMNVKRFNFVVEALNNCVNKKKIYV